MNIHPQDFDNRFYSTAVFFNGVFLPELLYIYLTISKCLTKFYLEVSLILDNCKQITQRNFANKVQFSPECQRNWMYRKISQRNLIHHIDNRTTSKSIDKMNSYIYWTNHLLNISFRAMKNIKCIFSFHVHFSLSMHDNFTVYWL